MALCSALAEYRSSDRADGDHTVETDRMSGITVTTSLAAAICEYHEYTMNLAYSAYRDNEWADELFTDGHEDRTAWNMLDDFDALTKVCKRLIHYRDRVGALNFQLEKADDFINEMRALINR